MELKAMHSGIQLPDNTSMQYEQDYIAEFQ